MKNVKTFSSFSGLAEGVIFANLGNGKYRLLPKNVVDFKKPERKKRTKPDRKFFDKETLRSFTAKEHAKEFPLDSRGEIEKRQEEYRKFIAKVNREIDGTSDDDYEKREKPEAFHGTETFKTFQANIVRDVEGRLGPGSSRTIEHFNKLTNKRRTIHQEKVATSGHVGKVRGSNTTHKSRWHTVAIINY